MCPYLVDECEQTNNKRRYPVIGMLLQLRKYDIFERCNCNFASQTLALYCVTYFGRGMVDGEEGDRN